MPDKVFVDTAAWIALLNSRDNYHLPARQVMDQLRQQKAALVTSEFVLLEVANALSNPPIRTQTVNFMDSLLQFFSSLNPSKTGNVTRPFNKMRIQILVSITTRNVMPNESAGVQL